MKLLDKVDETVLKTEEEKLRDGLYNLETIRFGKIPEIMIQTIFNFDDNTGTTAYDLVDNSDGHPKRIEVKFSCVREIEEEQIIKANALDVCLANSKKNSRMVEVNGDKKFDCNIQQVKPSSFDFLFYGLFYSNQIVVYGVCANSVHDFFTVSKLKSKILKFKKSKKEEDLNGLEEILKNIINDKDRKYLSEKLTSFKEEIQTGTDITDGFEGMIGNLLNEISEFSMPNLSPKQHGSGEKDVLEGQFHITHSNREWHDRYFIGYIPYSSLYQSLLTYKTKVLEEIIFFMKTFESFLSHREILDSKLRFTKKLNTYMDEFQEILKQLKSLYKNYNEQHSVGLDVVNSALSKTKKKYKTCQINILKRFIDVYKDPIGNLKVLKSDIEKLAPLSAQDTEKIDSCYIKLVNELK